MDDARRCTAQLSDGSRRCRKAAIKGGTVCASHGGSAPQVRRSARERLDALAEPAVVALEKVLGRVDKNEMFALSPAVIRVCKMVLDRTGYGPKSTIEIQSEAARLVAGQAERLAGALAHFASALGHDPADPHVRKAARAALLAAGDPDNPPPTPGPPARPATNGEPDTAVLVPGVIETPVRNDVTHGNQGT